MTGPARAERPPLAAQWLWTLGTQSTTYLVTALLIVAARVLGSEEFGHWSFAFALTLLLTPLTDLGASVYAGVIIARDGHRRAELVDNVLGLRLAAAPAYTALCAGAAALLLGRADVALLAALLAVDNAARGAATTFHVAFRAHGVFALETWATIAERGAIVALGSLALAAHPTFLAFTAAALLGRLAGLAVSAAVYARRFAAPRPRFALRVWRELVRRGSPLGLRATFSALGAHVDRVALGTFRPAMEVGWYGAAYQPFRGLGILPEVLANPMAPAVARAYSDRGLAAALPLFHRTLRYLVVAALPAVVGVSLLARPIIHLLYGDEYLPAAPALQLLIWAALLAFAQHTACVFLDNVDRRGFTVWAYALSLGLTVALELLLIPRFGYLGAAAAMLVAAVVSCALLFGYLARAGLGPPMGRVVLGPGAAALAAAAILWPAGESVAAVPLGPAALAAYALVLRATGAWGGDDAARLRSAWAGVARRLKGAPAAAAGLALLIVPAPLVRLSPPAAQAAVLAPYPSSTVIEGVTWDPSSLVRAASGSDLWPLTWAADDGLYAAWGAGGGFGGGNADGRVSLGVARVTGTPPALTGINVYGGKNGLARATVTGKSGGILAVGPVLYMMVTRDDVWDRGRMCASSDGARTWTCTGWDFEPPFHGAAFLAFGRAYQGARDTFVYAYNSDGASHLALARVPRDRLMARSAWEFFAGLDAGGRPRWTSDVSRRQPVFTDPNGTGWAPRATYHPVFRRYLLTAHHDDTGGWGLFDAPEPWGPWTTVAYYDCWLDATAKFGFGLTQKWMSPDGRTIWMVFSGKGPYEALNVIRGALGTPLGPVTAAPAGAPPTPPTGLAALVQGGGILLRWTPVAGAAEYRVERRAGTAAFQHIAVAGGGTTTYLAAGLSPRTVYSFRVRACGGGGCSAYSTEISATTAPAAPAPTPPPPAPASTPAPAPAAAAPGPPPIPAHTWVALRAGRGPGVRGWFQASFDDATGEAVLFGGSGDTYMSDTWAYRLATGAWQLLRAHPDLAGPCRRDNHNLVYDPGGRRHWLFNGIAYDNLQPGCAGAATRSGVWTYDRAANRWTRETVAGEHSLIAPGMAYNPDDRSVLEFGGSRENAISDTSRFDIAARAWTRLSPAGPLPPPRLNIEGGLVYDRASRVFVLFGGSGAKSDTWLFDPAARRWRDVTPALSPPGRELHAMAYDAASGVVILAGGRGADGAALDDTWVWSTRARAWRRLAAPGLPPVHHHSAVYHPGRRVVLLIPGLGLGDVYALRHVP